MTAAEKPRVRVTGADATGKPRMRAETVRPLTGGRETRVADKTRPRAMGAAHAGASYLMREMQGWITASGDADASIHEIETLRRRSYDLKRNAPIVTGAISTHRVETVGPGLTLQCRINNRLLEDMGVRLGDSPEAVEERVAEIEDKIESVFGMWADDPRECDVEQTKTFADHQDLMLVSEIVAGEGVALAVESEQPDSPWRMRLQSVHPARLSNPNNGPSRMQLDGGVERSRAGAVIRYHFLEAHPETQKVDAPRMIWRPIARYAPVSGRQQVFHVFRPDEPGQSRGVPLLAPVIHKLKQMDRYTDGEIMAAVVGGFFSVIFASENGETPDFDDDSELSEQAQRLGVDTDNDFALGHGTVMTAPDGMKPYSVAPGRPNPQFDAFSTSVLRQIGVALELPFEVLVGHFQSSYSAARAAILKAWKATITRREHLNRHFCTPVYRSWLQEAVANGFLDLPGWDQPGHRGAMIRHAWSSCTWIGPARGSIDPKKEYGAELDLNDAAIRPRSDISQLLTGQDWDSNIHRIARENRLMRKLSITPGRQSSTVRDEDEDPDAADRAELTPTQADLDAPRGAR